MPIVDSPYQANIASLVPGGDLEALPQAAAQAGPRDAAGLGSVPRCNSDLQYNTVYEIVEPKRVS